MEVLILGVFLEILFFRKKRSKMRVRIIHRCALYTGKYSKYNFANNIMPFEYTDPLNKFIQFYSPSSLCVWLDD